MDAALMIDLALAAVLLAGALIGAHRGLFKSLTGLAVVLAALVGAVLLANALAGPITDAVAPGIEDSLTRKFAEALEREETDAAEADRQELSTRLEKYGVGSEKIRELLAPLAAAAHDMADTAKEKAVDTFREAVANCVRPLVYGAAHAVLTLVLYIVLLFALRLLTRMLDHVFDLPVLSTFNSVGGAVFGLLETALLLGAALYAAVGLGLAPLSEHAEDARIMAFLLEHSPIEAIKPK